MPDSKLANLDSQLKHLRNKLETVPDGSSELSKYDELLWRLVDAPAGNLEALKSKVEQYAFNFGFETREPDVSSIADALLVSIIVDLRALTEINDR